MAENEKITRVFPIKSKKKPDSSINPESKYWKSFKSQQTPTTLVSPITSLAFSPDLFVVSVSTSLLLFDPTTSFQKPKSTFSPSSSSAAVFLSSSFRPDGPLLAAGDHSGLVQIFNLKSRLPLRRLVGHHGPVHLVQYPSSDHLHIFSGADDSLLKYWDIVSEKELSEFSGHRDYIRSGSPSPSSPHIFATGSYDHTIRLWDVRLPSGSSLIMELPHGKPVESLTFLPAGGGLLASAGGNSVKLWDILAGGLPVTSMETHTKTVTSLSIAKMKDDYRLVSAGLDGYMKVFDYNKMVVTHSMRFPAPLLCAGVSPDSSIRVAGSSNGRIFAGKMKERDQQRELKEEKKKKGFRYFRGGEYVVVKRDRVRLRKEEKLLKKFRHKEALVKALEGKNAERTIGVVEELVGRGKLVKCLKNLEGGEEELGLLVRFVKKKCVEPVNSLLVMGVGKKMVELRGEEIKRCRVLRWWAGEMKRMVDEEIKIQVELQKIQGMISPLLAFSGRR